MRCAPVLTTRTPTLQDAIALAFKCVRGLVKQIITDQRVLLIGFGLRTDLWSLQLDPARLSLGWALDLQHAQRWLETAAPAALPSVSSEGLSAMVAAYMAAPLDKAMQCSDWTARPLTPEQVRYAAADAACLLCLLSEMIDRVPDIDRREHATTDAGPGDRRGLRRPDPETLRRVAASWPGPAWEAAARPKRAAQRRREARKGGGLGDGMLCPRAPCMPRLSAPPKSFGLPAGRAATHASSAPARRLGALRGSAAGAHSAVVAAALCVRRHAAGPGSPAPPHRL